MVLNWCTCVHVKVSTIFFFYFIGFKNQSYFGGPFCQCKPCRILSSLYVDSCVGFGWQNFQGWFQWHMVFVNRDEARHGLEGRFSPPKLETSPPKWIGAQLVLRTEFDSICHKTSLSWYVTLSMSWGGNSRFSKFGIAFVLSEDCLRSQHYGWCKFLCAALAKFTAVCSKRGKWPQLTLCQTKILHPIEAKVCKMFLLSSVFGLCCRRSLWKTDRGGIMPWLINMLSTVFAPRVDWLFNLCGSNFSHIAG